MNAGARPRILDLCCGAGAVSVGYHRAGFEVTGVDIEPQPRYPYRFIQADALLVMDALASLGWFAASDSTPIIAEDFDAYHCSAPCQLWSTSTLSQRRRGKVYPDLITPMRPLLKATGKPWAMENVPQAPLRPDLELCGCMFGLELDGVGQLQRLRQVELSWHPEPARFPHWHHVPAISICGHGTPAWQRRLTGHVPVASWREVMGVGWMNREELTEAIPPVYAQYVGYLLMARLVMTGMKEGP